MTRWQGWLVCSALALLMASANPLIASQIVAKPGDSLPALMAGMRPGDELILTQGTYKAGKNWLKNKRGTKDAWFLVKAQDGAKVVIQNEVHENTVSLDNCSFWKFQNLEITGKIGGDAFKWTGDCSDMVIENCSLHDMDGAGINCSSIQKMERLYVGHCQIYNTGGMGEAMYLGHDGGPQAVCDSVFEYNLIHDTAGKPKSGAMGDGIEINEGGNGNTLRGNVIYNTWCPCITIENTRGKPNIVEYNICFNCREDADIQINSNAIVRNNTTMGGRTGLSLGPTVQAAGNVTLDPKDVSVETLLERAKELLKTKATAVPGPGGSSFSGGGGVIDPNAALIAHLRGEDGGSGEKKSDGSTPLTATESAPAAAPTEVKFNPDAVAQLRTDCIARIVVLAQDRQGVALSLLIGKEAQTVTLMPSDLKAGLSVKPAYSPKVVIAWADLATPVLGETLLALSEAGGDGADGALPGDRLLSALCYYLANRPVQVAEQVDKINLVDAAVGKQYGVRLTALRQP